LLDRLAGLLELLEVGVGLELFLGAAGHHKAERGNEETDNSSH